MSEIDFWLTSGWHLLNKDNENRLLPSEDFMKAYFIRPEVQIVSESCLQEIKLNKKLLNNPFSNVDKKEIELIDDNDVKFNYRMILNFRDFLSNSENIESAYLKFCKGQKINFPPLFLDHLVQIILRNILDKEPFPLEARVAEIFFRSQITNIQQDEIMLADQEITNLQVLDSKEKKNVDVDILRESTADFYWERSDRFDTSIDIAYTKPGLDALARVMEKWIYYFLKIKVVITPLQKIEDDRWSWHIGLDQISSSILDKLYNGTKISDFELKKIICLFKLETNKGFVQNMVGKPVYLALSTNDKGIIKMKPQNLLTNLPIKQLS